MTTRRKILLGLGVIALGATGLPQAQQSRRPYRIGVLETTPTVLNAANIRSLWQGLREHGYVEGRDIEIVYREPNGRDERFPGLARELVMLKVELFLTRGTPATLAAKAASKTIPVVMVAAGDPVKAGIVASLARPSGNVTGLSSFFTGLQGKRVEVLKGLVPGAARIAALLNMGNPTQQSSWKDIETAARSLSIQPQLLDVRKPEDFGRAFDVAASRRADSLIVGLDTLTLTNQRAITELAASYRLPAVYGSKDFVNAGGLISYGVSYHHLYYGAASFVHKILNGAKPSDLPVEEPTKFELVINRKTAKALGLSIPQDLLLRADEVIE